MNDEVRARLDEVAAADARLRRTAQALDEPGLRAPSLCEGWTRGHVLAHVALNAHSLVNLMEWARTGVEQPQYPSWEEREADIERFATRGPDEHVAALDEASTAFRGAATRLPSERWDFEVRGIGGDPQPVSGFLFGRLREVEIHHVDLDAGYGSSDWDDAFVAKVLGQVPERLGPGVAVPFVAEASDLDAVVRVGEDSAAAHVRGPGHLLLAWLLGRSDGSGLEHDGALPAVPGWG